MRPPEIDRGDPRRCATPRRLLARLLGNPGWGVGAHELVRYPTPAKSLVPARAERVGHPQAKRGPRA